jgi:hypothetical protein
MPIIPVTSGGRDQENHGSSSALGEILRDLISTNKKLGMVVCASHPSYTGNINGRIMVQTS